MRIITYTCPQCGTIVAGNVLESNRVMKCEGLGCEHVIRFDDLSEEDREHILENREQYRMED
jgi:SUMO ligase MMS21 Smc5/6 complex component